MSDLSGKTLFITGASRGIGLAIALRAARDGANIVIAAKSSEPHPKLPGTIYTAAEAIEQAGGQALPLQVDIQDEDQVAEAMAKAKEAFGSIDILVNNASAISLTDTRHTSMKRFDLMWGVNARGTYVCSQAAVPYLEQAENPHILMLSPPLNLNPRWFKNHVAYSMAKYGMSLCVLGMAEEFKDSGIAVNALWPCTAIHTAALAMLGGVVKPENCRQPEIVADAAYTILTRGSRDCTGHFFTDEQVLAEIGVTDFDAYAVDLNGTLYPDFFLDP